MKMHPLFTLLSLTFLIGCGPERKIEEQALFLCKIDQIDSADLDAFSQESPAERYVSAEDLAYLHERERDAPTGGFAALGEAFAEGMRPAIRAVAEARAARTRCEVTSLTVEGTRAEVALTQEERRLTELAPLPLIKELNALEDHAARVARAGELLDASGTTHTEQVSMTFVKQGEQWVRRYQLRERAEAEREAKEREEQAERLKAERLTTALATAREALELHHHEQAREAIELAAQIDPEADLSALRAELTEDLQEVLTGKWHMSEKVDKITDDHNVFLRLYAEEKVFTGFREELPTMIARCRERKLSLYVVVGGMIDASYYDDYRARTRYRFDKEEAQRDRMDTSTDRESVFFRKEVEWMRRLSEREDQTFILEVPLYNKPAVLITFDLRGAREALTRVLTACGKGE